MDLRKEIQVALNNCQPNTNRVDKIEAIAQKYAELYHTLQLQQTGVIYQLCECGRNILLEEQNKILKENYENSQK